MDPIVERNLAAVDRAAGKYISTARDKEFRARLDRLLARDEDGELIAAPRRDSGSGDAKGLAVIEAAGGGKSTLIEYALKKHPLLRPQRDGHRPWIKVHAPSPATTKSLGIQILIESGYRDVSRSKSEQEIWNMVRHRVRVLGTVFLWIDEAHDLFGGGNPHQVQMTLKALKNLMQGEDAVSVILSGIETLWQLASCDPQVTRRYYKFQLAPISAISDGRLLQKIVQTYCAQVGIEALSEGDLIARLVHASRHRFGRFVENLLAALESAALAGASRLDRQHFAEAWGLHEGCQMGENVFLADHWARIDLSHGGPDQRGQGV